MTKFFIQVKTIKDFPAGKDKPLVKSMRVDMPYAVLDVYKYRDRDGIFSTYFLIGDQDTGIMQWVDSHGVLFMGVG